MSKKKIDVTRRQFLSGAAGFTLALPFLPSLAERSAYGDAGYVRQPRFAFFWNGHGAALESNFFPDRSTLTNPVNLFSDHPIASGPLKATVMGNNAVLSPILTANASTLTPALVAKMNVIAGLDGPSHWGHNGAGLGNFVTGGDLSDADRAAGARPSIDQIMAYSPSFYPNLGGIRQRAIVLNKYNTLSYNYSDPTNRSGAIQAVQGANGSDQLKDTFNAIFGMPTTGMNPRPSIIDRVAESYRTLRNGNRRLSAADRQRLDDHIDRVNELERQINARPACGNLTQPAENPDIYYGYDAIKGNPDGAAHNIRLWIDMIVTAFMCGASRIAVFPLSDSQALSTYVNDWHQDIAHQWSTPTAQSYLVPAYQRIFENALVYMASKLDVEEAPGMTYLDNSLLAWSQECCMATHESTNVPLVTFGSGRGFLKTGQFVDYRKQGDPASAYVDTGMTIYAGILYAQWLATALQAMGVPPSEFERWGHKGYGYPYIDTRFPHYVAHYVNTSSRYFNMASDILPLLKA